MSITSLIDTEDAFLNGTGVGQPLGLFAENGGGQVVKSVAKQTAWREKSFQAVIFFIIFQKKLLTIT